MHVSSSRGTCSGPGTCRADSRVKISSRPVCNASLAASWARVGATSALSGASSTHALLSELPGGDQGDVPGRAASGRWPTTFRSVGWRQTRCPWLPDAEHLGDRAASRALQTTNSASVGADPASDEILDRAVVTVAVCSAGTAAHAEHVLLRLRRSPRSSRTWPVPRTAVEVHNQHVDLAEVSLTKSGGLDVRGLDGLTRPPIRCRPVGPPAGPSRSAGSKSRSHDRAPDAVGKALIAAASRRTPAIATSRAPSPAAAVCADAQNAGFSRGS